MSAAARQRVSRVACAAAKVERAQPGIVAHQSGQPLEIGTRGMYSTGQIVFGAGAELCDRHFLLVHV
jgi:hypothetical protein